MRATTLKRTTYRQWPTPCGRLPPCLRERPAAASCRFQPSGFTRNEHPAQREADYLAEADFLERYAQLVVDEPRLMFRELFEFRTMQTDPNFANYL